MGNAEEQQWSEQEMDLDQGAELILPAVVDGQLRPLSATEDPIIGGGLVGKGYAICPSSARIYAPISGRISSIAPTRHALTLNTPSDETILIHFGIDTIELKGKGFTVHVAEGEQVQVGDLLVDIDLPLLEEEGYDDIVCVILLDKPNRQLTVSLAKKEQVAALKDVAVHIRLQTTHD